MNHFRPLVWPLLACLAGLVAVTTGYGPEAGFITLILLVLEVSLSFDNAVVNARVLETMSPAWQQFFLTWGLVIPVFGVRFLGPLLIVSLSSGSSLAQVLDWALHDGHRYAELLEQAHPRILAFGGMFLLLVFLKFFFDKGKTVHWIEQLERQLVRAGKFESFEIAVALTILLVTASLTAPAIRADILISGLLGLTLNLVISSLAEAFGPEDHSQITIQTGKAAIASIVYLELLDASFSLDGAVGAFAITPNAILILVGLGLGALFIRALTVMLVRSRLLDSLVFLEHGAHYAIGSLGLLMLISINLPMPETLTGCIGLVLIGLALADSWRYRRRQRSGAPR